MLSALGEFSKVENWIPLALALCVKGQLEIVLHRCLKGPVNFNAHQNEDVL